MGLADTLVLLGMCYDSDQAVAFAGQLGGVSLAERSQHADAVLPQLLTSRGISSRGEGCIRTDLLGLCPHGLPLIRDKYRVAVVNGELLLP